MLDGLYYLDMYGNKLTENNTTLTIVCGGCRNYQ